MKTKDEGTAWLRSHGWVQCDRGWRKPGMTASRTTANSSVVGHSNAISIAKPGAYPTPMTTQQATTMQEGPR